jgi:RND superfamily putative drug exporter
MFSKISQIAQKFKYFIIAGWVIVTVVLVLTAPQISDVGVTDQSQFLPQNTDSALARNLINTKFGNVEQSSSSLLIVVYHEDGLNQVDMDRAKSIYAWLISEAAPESVSGVISVFTNEALQSSLVSSDNSTMLMTVELSVPALDEKAQQAVNEIRNQFAQQTGTSFYLTGNVGRERSFNSCRMRLAGQQVLLF